MKTIQECAEEYTVSLDVQDLYTKFVTHYLSQLEAEGYEMEKDVLRFAEWCFNERYYLIGGSWSKNPFHTDEVYYTTSELYQIFKQQKP